MLGVVNVTIIIRAMEKEIITTDCILTVKELKFSEEKTATLELILKSQNGYYCKESHEISPHQWHEIVKILQK